MAGGVTSIPVNDFRRGIHAEASRFSVPKGAILRASNLMLATRGALTTVDGDTVIASGIPHTATQHPTQLIHWIPTGASNNSIVALIFDSSDNSIQVYNTTISTLLGTISNGSITANGLQALDALIIAPGLNQFLSYTTGGVFSPINNSNFTGSSSSYPQWTASTAYSNGGIVSAIVSGTTYFFQAIQSGTSGTAPPSWNVSNPGAVTTDNNLRWLNFGNSGSAPPPGAEYVFYHEGFIWIWGTSPTYLSDGINGPTTLWQSGLGDLHYWNPQFSTFIGKGDGQTIEGGAVFAQAEAGILSTPQLILFKSSDTYQIVGAFPAIESIIKVKTGVGCVAPDTIRFLPGMGIMRMSQYGPALFNGQDDIVDPLTDPIRPYLFGGRGDITPVDWMNMSTASAALVANPPGYWMIVPLSGGNGANVRGFFLDRILKAWTVIDFPASLGPAIYSEGGPGAAALAVGRTMALGASDGLLREYFNGDTTWDTGAAVAWSFRTPPLGSPGVPVFYRRLNLRISAAATQNILASSDFNSTSRSGQQFQRVVQTQGNINPSLGATVSLDIGIKALGGGYLDISGSGPVTIEGLEMQLRPQPAGRIGFS